MRPVPIHPLKSPGWWQGIVFSRLPQPGVVTAPPWFGFMRFRWAPIPGDALVVRDMVGVRSPWLWTYLILRDSGERCSESLSSEGGYGMLSRRERDRELLLELSREARLMEANREYLLVAESRDPRLASLDLFEWWVLLSREARLILIELLWSDPLSHRLAVPPLGIDDRRVIFFSLWRRRTLTRSAGDAMGMSWPWSLSLWLESDRRGMAGGTIEASRSGVNGGSSSGSSPRVCSLAAFGFGVSGAVTRGVCVSCFSSTMLSLASWWKL